MATLGTSLFTLFSGRLVGRDAFGNRYYEARGRKKEGVRRKRWVMYKGKAEPSKVPAHWHTWLHYTTDTVPAEGVDKKYSWQKEHVPNLTGTKGRYLPEGHLLAGGERAKTTADYTAWTPKP
jgi:NADH:ubiquinone oxidoreductase subunit